MGHVSTLTRNVLETLLSTDLGFHAERSNYGPHAIHAFAAKFPPQLPRFFIEALTSPGQVVLDPMMGSGTTIVEAETAGRVGIGIDLDPLAVLIAKAKAGHIPPAELRASYLSCVSIAQKLIRDEAAGLQEFLDHNFDSETKEFIEFWFAPKTQQALAALLLAIRSVTSDIRVASMLRVLFSSIIITKSGGVSRARDLAHTRPHLDPTKPEKDAIHEFSKKCMKVLRALEEWPKGTQQTVIAQGDARALPLASSSVDCVVTSPPYANAIDYMRANKFSLVWFGYPIKALSQRRACYIGAEKLFGKTGRLPAQVRASLKEVEIRDSNKAKIIEQYFIDMTQAIAEVKRVLRRDGTAIIVVGPSTIRGAELKTHVLLADIMEQEGFEIVDIAERQLDRDRRLLPASSKTNGSQIEQRIHNEFVIAGVCR